MSKDGFDIWKMLFINIRKKELIKNLHKEQLKYLLVKIARRKLRDYAERIVGEGNKVKGALKTIYFGFQRKPRNAFFKWKNTWRIYPRK